MNKDEFIEFKKIYLENYRKIYKEADYQGKRHLKEEINNNINLTMAQKDKLWELIVA